MGASASLPQARPELWTVADGQEQAGFFIQREGYQQQIALKRVDGSKLSRLNPRFFRKLGFERIGWPSCGSVTGELHRVLALYGEERDESVDGDEDNAV